MVVTENNAKDSFLTVYSFSVQTVVSKQKVSVVKSVRGECSFVAQKPVVVNNNLIVLV